MTVLGKHRAEGLRTQDTSHSQLRPAQPHTSGTSVPTPGPPLPGGLCPFCCSPQPRHGDTGPGRLRVAMAQGGSSGSPGAAGTLLETRQFCLSQLRLRGKPNFRLSRGSTSAKGFSLGSLFLGQRVRYIQVPLPKAPGASSSQS